MALATTRFDDRDSAVVLSQSPNSSEPDWEFQGQPSEYMSTTTHSSRRGATAVFSFSGSSVAVYGSISPDDPIPAASSYSIDGGAPLVYRVPPNSPLLFRQRFFQSPTLSGDRHMLVITNEADDDNLWIDYFDVTPARDRPDQSPSDVTSSSSPLQTGLVASATLIGSPTTIFGQPTRISTQTTDRNHVAAIVGVILGGVVVLVVLLYVLCRKQRKRAKAMEPPRTFDPDI